ncbi:MAG TPA: hypothetical protein VGK29_12040 [Paludibaculum sp.]|jgi:hypothetical protein
MLWKLSGGARGMLLVAAIAAIGVLVPRRFGFLFLDPAILLLYSAIAVVFASNFVVRGVVGQDDEPLIRRVVLNGALFGWVCWLVILGAALAALSARAGRLVMPSVFLTLGLIVLTGSVAWLAACFAALIAISMDSVRTAQGMTRMALFFVLLIFIVLPRLLPAAWQAGLGGLLTSGNLGRNLLLLSPLPAYAGYWLMSRVHRVLDDRSTPLSIT